MDKASDLKTRLQALDSKFAASIESLASMYPQYKMNPDFSTYARTYSADMGAIDSVHQEYAAMRERIRTELDNMQSKLKNINIAISDTSVAKKDMDVRKNSLVGAEQSAQGQSAFFDAKYRSKLWTIAGLVAGSAFVLYRSSNR